VLGRLRKKLAKDVAIISVGGLETVEDACERLARGATLLQLYTGFIYGGPRTPVVLAKGIASRR
jgi:dihydroorotate dehydrogenase